jgi:ethanolamine utilization protein EutN
MHPARVIGRVVATRKVEALRGLKLLLLQPTDWQRRDAGEPLVAIDSVGAGAAEWVFYVKSREAAVSVATVPPVDAAVVGIIDGTEIDLSVLEWEKCSSPG